MMITNNLRLSWEIWNNNHEKKINKMVEINLKSTNKRLDKISEEASNATKSH